MPNFGRCLVLPPELAAQGVTLRGETEADEAFLHRLYVVNRWPELAASGWPDEAKLEFLSSQFALQRHHYLTYYGAADFGIVEIGGEPAGRLCLHRTGGDLRIVDILLLPERRGGGIGTLLLRAVQAEAAADRRPVSIHVEQFNPAQTLYRRLGFRETGGDGPYWRMDWYPSDTEESEHAA